MFSLFIAPINLDLLALWVWGGVAIVVVALCVGAWLEYKYGGHSLID